MWKVYEIDSGRILMAGFEDEDQARDWYDERGEDLEGLYTIDEMDEDEEYEWTEEQQKLAEKQEEEYYEEKDELDDHPEPH